jgi:hypothetical protein
MLGTFIPVKYHWLKVKFLFFGEKNVMFLCETFMRTDIFILKSQTGILKKK